MSDNWTITSDDTLRDDCATGQSEYEHMRSRAKSNLAQFIYCPQLRPYLAAVCTPMNEYDELRIEQLRALPEFQHWNDPRSGKANIVHDLWLMSTGRQTLEDLFRRGPAGTREERLRKIVETPLRAYTVTRRDNRRSKDLGDQLSWSDEESEHSKSSNRRWQHAQHTTSSKYQPHYSPNMVPIIYNRVTDFHMGKRPNCGPRSSWNDILRAASFHEHFIDTREDSLVTDPPPTGFLDLYYFTMPLNLDTSFMRTLPEFRHWNDAGYGGEAELKDLELFKTGNRSLVYLFLRGAVYPWWYPAIERLIKFENQDAYMRLSKLAGVKHGAFDAEVFKVKDDFRDVARVYLQDQFRIRSRVAERQSARRPAFSRQPASNSPVSSNTRPRDRYTPNHTSTFNGKRDSDSDTCFLPARRQAREQTPPVSPRTKPMPSRTYSHGGASKHTELKFGDMPAIQIRRQMVTEAGPSRQPQQTLCTELRDLERLKKNMAVYDRLAADHRAQYEQARATIEGTDKFRVGSGDIAIASGGEGKGKKRDAVSFQYTDNDTKDPRSQGHLAAERKTRYERTHAKVRETDGFKGKEPMRDI